MKTLALGLSFMLSTFGSFAQGTVIFSNIGPGFDFPALVCSRPAGSIGMRAQLLIVGSGGALTPLATTTFRNSSPQAMYYFEPLEVTVPRVPSGETVNLRIHIYTGSDYPTAMTKGYSRNFPVTLGGGNLPPGTFSSLGFGDTLRSYPAGPCPEPSTVALSVLAASLLFLLRKRTGKQRAEN